MTSFAPFAPQTSCEKRSNGSRLLVDLSTVAPGHADHPAQFCRLTAAFPRFIPKIARTSRSSRPPLETRASGGSATYSPARGRLLVESPYYSSPHRFVHASWPRSPETSKAQTPHTRDFFQASFSPIVDIPANFRTLPDLRRRPYVTTTMRRRLITTLSAVLSTNVVAFASSRRPLLSEVMLDEILAPAASGGLTATGTARSRDTSFDAAARSAIRARESRLDRQRWRITEAHAYRFVPRLCPLESRSSPAADDGRPGSRIEIPVIVSSAGGTVDLFPTTSCGVASSRRLRQSAPRLNAQR